MDSGLRSNRILVSSAKNTLYSKNYISQESMSEIIDNITQANKIKFNFQIDDLVIINKSDDASFVFNTLEGKVIDIKEDNKIEVSVKGPLLDEYCMDLILDVKDVIKKP